MCADLCKHCADLTAPLQQARISLFLNLENEMVSSSPGVQTSESMHIRSACNESFIFSSENFAHTPSSLLYSPVFQRIRCKSPISSVHECLHTACTGMQRMHRLDIDISDEGTDKKMALLIFILICFLRLAKSSICLVTVCGKGYHTVGKEGGKMNMDRGDVPMTVTAAC